MLFRKKMVYLSPHTTTVLDYNPEDIYIIGGLVDKFQVPISHNKARKELIRSASLPLDQHLQWKHGTKSLCIHHVSKLTQISMESKKKNILKQFFFFAVSEYSDGC